MTELFPFPSTADLVAVSGMGITAETFDIAGTTYDGFSIVAGTYIAIFGNTDNQTSDQVTIRGHTAFPTTAAEVTAATSTLLAGSTGSVNNMTHRVFAVTDETKIWAYPNAGTAIQLSFWLMRIG